MSARTFNQSVQNVSFILARTVYFVLTIVKVMPVILASLQRQYTLKCLMEQTYKKYDLVNIISSDLES